MDKKSDCKRLDLLDFKPAAHENVVESAGELVVRRCGTVVGGAPLRGEVASKRLILLKLLCGVEHRAQRVIT